MAYSHRDAVDNSPWKEVLKMAREGDSAGIKAWVKAGGDVNQDLHDQYTYGETTSLLTLFATEGDTDMVRFLLAQGADIEKKIEGHTALVTAVIACLHPAYNPTEVVKVLIEGGASVDEIAPRRGNQKPLLFIAAHQPGVLCVLLRAGADHPSLHTRWGSNIEKYVKDEFDDAIKWMTSGDGDVDARAETARNLEVSGGILAAVRTGGSYTSRKGKQYVIDGIVQDV